MKKAIKLLIKTAAHIAIILCPFAAQAQVSVSLSPVPKLQFLNNAGQPLASGCVFFYAAGTTTPQAAYTDSTGTAQLSNPLILDAGGFSSPTGIWLANQSYKIKVVSAGGVNCATGVTQYTIDGISSALGLLNLVNTWTASNTFQQPIIITPNANQLVLGAPAAQTTLNAPAPAGNITINLPTVADTLVGLAASQTLTNKTLTSPTINSALIIGGTIQSPAILQGYPNNLGSASTAGLLVKFSNIGCVAASDCIVNATTSDTGGVIGICVSNCGTVANGFVSTIGTASCTFDGATTQGDYVQISSTVNGNCHDAGATYPSSGQVIGRVLTTNGGGGFYNVTLFGTELRAPGGTAAVVNLTGQGANIASTPFFTPTANGFFRFSCYTVVTQAATVSSTLPSCNVLWTDADTSVSETGLITSSVTTNTVGTIGAVPGGQALNWFYAKSGVAISYSTTGYATNGATSMQYAIRIRLEGPF